MELFYEAGSLEQLKTDLLEGFLPLLTPMLLNHWFHVVDQRQFEHNVIDFRRILNFQFLIVLRV